MDIESEGTLPNFRGKDDAACSERIVQENLSYRRNLPRLQAHAARLSSNVEALRSTVQQHVRQLRRGFQEDARALVACLSVEQGAWREKQALHVSATIAHANELRHLCQAARKDVNVLIEAQNSAEMDAAAAEAAVAAASAAQRLAEEEKMRLHTRNATELERRDKLVSLILTGHPIVYHINRRVDSRLSLQRPPPPKTPIPEVCNSHLPSPN
jgi:hypothetical protein